MNKDEILSYIKQNDGVEIASLQQKFNLTYKEAKELIDELVAEGSLVYESEFKYKYINNSDKCKTENEIDGADKDSNETEENNCPVKIEMDELHYRILKLCIYEGRASVSLIQHTYPVGYIKACKLIDWMEENRYIEKYKGSDTRRILIKKDNFNKNFFEPYSPPPIYADLIKKIDEDELRYEALKLCVIKRKASVSLFIKSFHIDCNRACALIDWMEGSGYVSKLRGTKGRRVLITQEEFDKLYESNDNIDAIIYNLFHSDEDENLIPIDYNKPKGNTPEIIYSIDRFMGKIKTHVIENNVPPHNLWFDENDFEEVVVDRIKRLIMSDGKMGKKGAIKKAEIYLEAVRDTNDTKMVQVYERIIFELKNISVYRYNKLKKQFFR